MITPPKCLSRTRVNRVKIIQVLQIIQRQKDKISQNNKNQAQKIKHPQPLGHPPHHHCWTDDVA